MLPTFNLNTENTILDTLIDGCKKGDRLSQEKLYKQFYPALFSLCKLFFDDNHEALSALNNGMLQVFKNIASFDVQKGSLFNWMYTLVRNAALTQLRNKKSIFETNQLADNVELPAKENLFNTLESKELYQTFSILTQSTRAVCKLYYLDDFSVKEIALLLQLSDGTIKWHLSEGRKQLKTFLQKSMTI